MEKKRHVEGEGLTFLRFVEEFYPLLRSVSQELEMDFNFHKDGIVVHDMGIPSAIRSSPALITREDLTLPRAELEQKFRILVHKFMNMPLPRNAA